MTDDIRLNQAKRKAIKDAWKDTIWKRTPTEFDAKLSDAVDNFKQHESDVWNDVVKPTVEKNFPPEDMKVLQRYSRGSGQPLCARQKRDYIVKFTAHGSQKKKVGQEEKGGCYAGQGFTVFSWKATAKQKQEVSDAVKLSEWVKTLPYGSMIRHHVAGDIGK